LPFYYILHAKFLSLKSAFNFLYKYDLTQIIAWCGNLIEVEYQFY